MVSACLFLALSAPQAASGALPAALRPVAYVTPSGSVSLVHADGRTTTLGDGWAPRLTADKKQLVMMTEPPGPGGEKDRRVVLVDIDSGRRRTVVRGLVANPSISPDGSFVSVARYQERGWELWVYPVGGGEGRRLSEYDGISPEWSPDSTGLFWADIDGLAQIALDGRTIDTIGLRDLLQNKAEFGWTDRFVPHPRRPGVFLISSSVAAGSGSRDDLGLREAVMVADLTAKTITVISPSDLHASEAVWAPGGEAVVFTGRASLGGEPALYLVPAQGGMAPVRLIAGSGATF